MKKLLILTNEFYSTSAGFRRIEGVANIFLNCDYLIRCYMFSEFEFGHEITIKNNFVVVSLGNPLSTRQPLKTIMLLYGKKTVNKIFEREKSIDLIYVYSSISLFAVRQIIRISKTCNIKLVFDVVEHRKLFENGLKSLILYNVHNNYIRHLIKRKSFKVICISKYIYDWFEKESAFYLPNIQSCKIQQALLESKSEERGISYIYAGSPGKRKDMIDTIVLAFLKFCESIAVKATLNVYGIDLIFLKKFLSYKQYDVLRNSSSVVFYGKKSRDVIIKAFSKSDFSINLRNPELLSSKAGFSTKIVESLSFGVPVITNYYGELNSFLKNGYNSYIVNDCTIDGLCSALTKSVLEYGNLKFMKANSLQTVLDFFEPSIFAKSFFEWIEE